MPALSFDRCTAPVKLPFRECLSQVFAGDARRRRPPEDERRSRTAAGFVRSLFFVQSTLAERCERSSGVSLRPSTKKPPVSHLLYASVAPSQSRVTRVKFNRVFFPRRSAQARSLGCGFAREQPGTVGISFIHSCTSLIR